MKEWNVKYKDKTIPTIKGNDYEIGFALGQLFRGEYKKLKGFKKQLREPVVNEYIAWLLPFLRNNFRPAYDEICGRADGAEIDVKLLAYRLCKNEIRNSNEENCTTIMVSGKNNLVLAHNEDIKYDKNAKVVKIERRGSGMHYEIATVNSLCSSTIFVSKNLVYTLNSIPINTSNLKFLPTNIFRKLLSCCQTFEDLLETVKSVSISSAIGINVCDVKNKKFYCIEKALDKFDVKEISGINIHTNHVLSKKFLPLRAESVKNKISTSLSRQFLANDLLMGRKDIDAHEAYRILTYYGTCDFNSVMQKANTGHKAFTFGTYVLDLNNKTSCLHIHNKQKTVFDLDLPKF